MNHRVTAWTKRLAESPHGIVLIFFASFLESLILPIPLEVILIPYMIKERQKVWLIGTAALLGCLLGATVGYFVGMGLFETVGRQLLETLDYTSQFRAFQSDFQQNGFWAILSIGVTPIPFQVAMLTAGAAGYPFLLYLLASAIARGIRYYGLALMVVLVGEQALALWKRHSKAVGLGILALVVGGYAVARLL